MRVDPRRCACSAFDKSPAVREVVCFDKDTGECPRASPLPQQLNTNRSWFPQEYPNCARKTDIVSGVAVDHCIPFTTTAPVAASAFCPPGQTCPKVPGDLTPKVYHLGWEWITERTNYPGHFRPEWFELGQGAFGGSYAKSTVGFTFATRTFLDGVIPGTSFPQDSDVFAPKAKTFNRPVGQHADVDPWIRSDDPTEIREQALGSGQAPPHGQPPHALQRIVRAAVRTPPRPQQEHPERVQAPLRDTSGPVGLAHPVQQVHPHREVLRPARRGVARGGEEHRRPGRGEGRRARLGADPGRAGRAAGRWARFLDCLISNCGPPEVSAGWQITALPAGP
ncbi:MAG: hypothetical protein IPI67_14140 [Myxococcales bacterium]|nr:hypothetical protein [Myxococcales bacterium]